MRLRSSALAAVAIVAVPVTPAAAAPAPASPYLVTLQDWADPTAILASLRVGPLFTYHNVFRGFAARLAPMQVTTLRRLPAFQAIEPDASVTALPVRAGSPTTQAAGSWGLDRIDQRGLPLDGTYAPLHNGAGVTAYIVDTGIEFDHPEVSGRAYPGFDAIGDGRDGGDCNGHGTHVAGTVGGLTYGVAPAVDLVSIRVLGCDGRGTWSGIIAGFDWIAGNGTKPAVANVSLGGTPGLNAVDAAVNKLVDSGIFVAVAGGNDTADSCGYSPARAAKVFTIGATGRGDGYADYSNRGQCVQLLAPGTDIVSAGLGGTTKTLSGTSMAAPHVTGVAALYKQAYGDDAQATIMDWFWANATYDAIANTPGDTPNALLYTAGL